MLASATVKVSAAVAVVESADVIAKVAPPHPVEVVVGELNPKFGSTTVITSLISMIAFDENA
jgi:hypothetical protein